MKYLELASVSPPRAAAPRPWGSSRTLLKVVIVALSHSAQLKLVYLPFLAEITAPASLTEKTSGTLE
ncbi:hypothetical protein SRHO_G00246920 [Serrasalmus rhombeus]